MKKTVSSKLIKAISFAMAVLLVVGVLPVRRDLFEVFAAENGNLCIQVIRDGAIIGKDEKYNCSISNTDSLFSYSGITAENGIWETGYVIGDNYDGKDDFSVTVDTKTFTVSKDLKTAEKYLICDIGNGSYKWSENAETKAALISIDAISPISGIENGADKSADALGLPKTVRVQTTAGEKLLNVEWNVDGAHYSSTVYMAQSFSVDGTVLLDDETVNPDNVSLAVSVNVSVNAENDATVSITPKNVSIKASETLTLKAEATLCDSATFEWYKNGDIIGGESKSELVIKGITAADEGEYKCSVKGLNGVVVFSNSAYVSVNKISLSIALSASDKTVVRPTKKGVTLTVSGLPTDANGQIAFYVDGVKISEGTQTSVTFKPTSKNDYVFKAVYEGDDKYSAASDELNFSFTKGTQNAITFKNIVPSEIWLGDNSFIVRVSGGSGDGDIVYSVVEQKDDNGNATSGVARVTTAGTVFVEKTGEFKVTVQKLGDDDYNDSEILTSGVIKVVKKAQGEFGFDIAAPDTIRFNENGNEFVNAATGGSGAGDITYSVNDDSVAVVDVTVPSKILIKKAGTVVVTAVRSGGDKYLDAKASYSLTIEKADQIVEFSQDLPSEIFYGQDLICVAAEKENITMPDGRGFGTGEITYSITEGGEIASIDPKTGELTFADKTVGVVTVTATKAACDCYSEAVATYTVEVKPFVIDGTPYEISGEKKNENGWYTGDVTITAQSGYMISTNQSRLPSNSWDKATLAISNEGASNGVTVYFRNVETGAISEGFEISDDQLKIDKEKPYDLAIIYSNEYWWEDIAKAVMFGSYDSNISFTVEAKDNHSGVSSFEWEYNRDAQASEDIVEHLEGSGKAEMAGNGKYFATFTLPITDIDQIRGRISFAAFDVAGWEQNFEDTRLIIVDSVDPVISITYEGNYKSAIDKDNIEVPKDAPGARLIYAGDIKAVISVNEENFWPEIMRVTLDGTDVDCVWSKAEEGYKATINISGEGEHILKVEGTDASYTDDADKTEHTVEVTSRLIIDTVAPTLTVKAPVGKEGAKNGKYFSDEVSVEISVAEEYFDPAGVAVYVEATDAEGNKIGISTDFGSFVKDSKNWVYENGEHKINIIFGESARYILKVTYEDHAGLRAEKELEEFVIDKTAPDKKNITISYNEDDIVNRIANILYFRSVRVTITASDDISGIDYINWSYERTASASEVNAESANGTVEHKDLQKISEKEYSASVKIPREYIAGEQFDGNFSAEAFNMAGLGSESVKDERRVVVDSIAPGRKIEYGTPHMISGSTGFDTEIFSEGDNVKLYYSQKAELKLTINDANFYAEDINSESAELNGMNCKVTAVKDAGEPYALAVTDWQASGDNHIGTIVLDSDGEYVVTVEYNDRSGNTMEKYVTPAIIVDSVKPVISGTVSPEGKYIDEERELKVVVSEKNFRASDFTVYIREYDLEGAEEVKNVGDAWSHNGDEHTIKFRVNDEARYEVIVNGKDLSCNEADTFSFDEFVIDRTAPEIKSIDYKTPVNEALISALTFGYFNPSVEVTVTAHDSVSGVEKVICEYLRADDASSINEVNWSDSFTFDNDAGNAEAKAKFTLPEKSFNGHFSADAIDRSANTTAGSGKTYHDSGYRVVVDSTAPKWMEASISAEQYINESTLEVIKDLDGVSDKWFAMSKEKAVIKFKINEANFYPDDFNDSVSALKGLDCKVTLSKDGGSPYPVQADWENNGDIHTGTVTITDEGDYYLSVSYSDRSGNKMASYTSPKIAIDRTAPVITAEYVSTVSPENGRYYRQDVTVNVTVNERYFRPEDMNFELDKAADIAGVKIASASEIKGALEQSLKNKDNWIHNGNVHTATITFSADANYRFALDCVDVAGNASEKYDSEEFTVDKTTPYGIMIDYSEPKFSSVISAVTFNYYNPSAIITVTASDDTAGVDRISWSYNKAEGASSTNTASDSGVITDLSYSSDGRVATGSFTLPYSSGNGQYNGNITASVTDRAGNSSPEYKDDGTVVVIDTISPTREVEFSPAKQVVQVADSTTVESYNYKTEGSKFKLYYDSSATATIRITEANFYPEDVTVKINGERTNVSAWSQSGDVWTGTVSFEKDGHYVVTIEYTDRSQNGMVSYVSNEVIVDSVDPVIKVTYSPDKVIKTIDKRKYYDGVQKATITITEHNFRASDVAAVVTASDISGTKVNVENYAEYLKKESSWSTSGDTHTATITYSNDANYTFDIDYIDLALRKAADYPEDNFSVDTTPPESLKISYSSSVLDTVINSVAFSFYNSKVRATITARDVTSGVSSFTYSYVKTPGSGLLNAELINQQISDGSISYTDGGKTATAYFDIPRQVLDSTTQFKGTVRFSAADRAGNVSETLADNRTLVVDNIAPIAKVTFNQPVHTVNDVSYYSGDIVASIEITEANFYPEDAIVTVNGGRVSLRDWSQSGDKWLSNLTISEDGEYKVAISYTDRSKNAMNNYESGKMVIDRAKPVVTVSGIRNESANKDEKIGFRISVNDANLDAAEFKPQLMAVVMNDNGVFTTEAVSTGAIQTIEQGKSYFCTVENLEKDAIYTLTCKATDRSGNVNDVMTIVDSGNAQLSQVMFSVNRNGSTFMLDDYTRSVVDKYYLGSVDNNIVVVEINVDQLTSHEVKLNQKTLVQGSDYTVTRTGGGASWNKYTYSINSGLFASEGEYNVVVSSIDKAETMSFSDIRNAEVSFLVDKTAPTVTVSGLTRDGRYQADKQLVTIIPTDDAGKIYSVKVLVKDNKGNVISTPIDLSGEELIAALEANGNKLTFELGEGMYQNVEIICTDKSGNEYASGNEYFNVTVSPSGWVIMWANPIFKWSLFGSLGVVAVMVLLIIIIKKRKKSEENNR